MQAVTVCLGAAIKEAVLEEFFIMPAAELRSESQAHPKGFHDSN